MKLTAATVAGFVGSVLSNSFDGAVASPDFHKECWELCCSDHRQVAIAAPRKHAKTTAITLGYGLATLLFRQRKYMIIVSDTESQATMFLQNLRQEIADNPMIRELFDIKVNEQGEVDFVKDSQTDIIVPFTNGEMFRIMAKGAEQKLRGMNWNGARPDIIICDDLENDELVLNKERREKLRRWFYAALLPALSHHGIIRVVGTILHMDSLLESFMPETIVNTIKGQNPRKYYKRNELKSWLEYPWALSWESVRYRAHNEDFSAILWPEAYDKTWFELRYADYAAQGITDLYSQEFLNQPLDEANTYFKRQDFLPITKEDHKKTLNYYITADLAISEKEKADYSVFVVAGVDENKRIHVKNVIRERLDGRDIIDTLLSLQRLYDPVAVGIEEMQISKALGPFLREEMVKQNVYLNLYPMKHMNKDKIFRSRSIQARMRAGGVKFEKEADWYQAFEDECMRFPRDKHDDQVDAFAYLGLMLDYLIEAPTVEEQEEDEYWEEYNESNSGDEGRNRLTGY